MTMTSNDLATLLSDGIAHHNAGRLPEAIARYEHILRLAPAHADALYMRGMADLQQGRATQALPFFDAALIARPDFVAAQVERASALIDLGCCLEALEECDKVLKANPMLARAWTNRAFALYHLKRLQEALHAADRAIAARPSLQDAHLCRAIVLLGLDRKQVAMEMSAVALTSEEQSDLNALHAASARETDHHDLLVLPNGLHEPASGVVLRASESLNVARHVCHWNRLDRKTLSVFAELKEARKDARPYTLLLTPASPMRQKEAAELYFRSAFGDCLPRPRASTSSSKICVAYLSSDFCDHPVAHVVAGLLEAHDRSKFEITCVALGGDATSPPRHRIAAACDRLIDVVGKSDEEIISIVRALNVDIAVDLNGYTKGARTAVFASGIAPIQVNYLGYPGTLGSACYDYIIGDSVTTPLNHASHFTECLALLPHTYFPANRGMGIPEQRAYSRFELNLPEKDFVFCCFNGAVKITPDLFDIWMRLLKAIDRSVLWLLYTSAEAARNLRAEARKRGVSGDTSRFCAAYSRARLSKATCRCRPISRYL